MRFLLLTTLSFVLSTCTPIIKPLLWLEGTWQMPVKNGYRYEEWEFKNLKSMAGKGYKVIGQDTTLLETIKIVAKASEAWYIPTVPDQNDGNPVQFKLKQAEFNVVYVFENLDHDFPQRISYQFRPVVEKLKSIGDTLLVRVEGNINGENKGIDFKFIRQ